MQKDQTTEYKILESARKVFLVKGMHGARMQDIADKAGINKAMLHYYFRSKEQLFDAVLKEVFQKLFPKVKEFLESDSTLQERIENFVVGYMNILIENPFLPAFVIHEINQDPERFQRLFLPVRKIIRANRFMKQIQLEIRKGKIKPFDPRQLIVNMLSLCIFPFAARPVICKVMNMREKEFRLFIEERKKIIPLLILQSIKSK